MNISLSAAAERQKQKKAKLSFGLNDSKATSKETNVFGDDDDEEDSERQEELTGRDQVNRALLREQDALRRRAAQSGSSRTFRLQL
jgi:hypothetical protein